MVTVLIFLKGKEEHISINVNETEYLVKEDLTSKMKHNKVFSIIGKNGTLILQTDAVSGFYIEKN